MQKKIDKETLRKLQLTELKCLDEVKRICELHNLKYFLIAGTLIGAIRHKGFIPWDDDIDIGMMRDDYEKFLEYCKTDLNIDEFFLQTPETEKDSADFELARIRLNNTKFIETHRKDLQIHHGIFVEVFPYDDLPESQLRCLLYSDSFRILKKAVGIRMGYRYKAKNLLNRFIIYFMAFCTKIIPLEKMKKIMNNYHLKYQNPNSKYVFLIAGGTSYKEERHLRTTVTELSQAEFEGKLYPIPKNYHEFLSEQYGDYMTPPPIEKQVNQCLVEEIDFGKY